MLDAEAIAAFRNAIHLDEIGRPFTDEAEVATELSTPGYDPHLDALLVFAWTGELVGSMGVWSQEPFTTIHLDNYVHPGWRERGIGTFVLERSEARAAEVAAGAPAGSRVVARHSVWVGAERSERLLTAHGYRPIRYFRSLEVTLADPPAPADRPAGITLRTLEADEDLRPVHEAETEAFADHWGTTTHPFDVWSHELLTGSFDPSLIFLAEAEGQIAGVATWQVGNPDDPNAVYLATLSVRRPWRNRGIATALLHEGIGALFRRGHRRITTIVDSESLTGADRLYERVGMRPFLRFAVYGKVLREGSDGG
jgi:GNAT superfamily N-acetyltransferase